MKMIHGAFDKLKIILRQKNSSSHTIQISTKFFEIAKTQAFFKFKKRSRRKKINKNSKKLKILGTGEIKDKINIEADLASKSAIEKLEKISGSIQLKK